MSAVRAERRRRARSRCRIRKDKVLYLGHHTRWSAMGRLLATDPRSIVAMLASNAIYGKFARPEELRW